MLLGVRQFPVRVFLNPDLDVLLETNTRAGIVLYQVAFDRFVQRYLGSQVYWEKVDEFRSSTGQTDEDLDFSERDLLDFLRGSTAKSNGTFLMTCTLASFIVRIISLGTM